MKPKTKNSRMAAINLDAKWENPILENYFYAHDEKINSISFNHSGKQLASASDDGVFKIWNFKTQTTRSYIFNDNNGPIKCTCFSPNGSLVASAAGSSVQIRTPEMQTTSWSFRPHTLSVLGIDFAPCSESLATCSADKTIKVWTIDGASCRFKFTLNGHQNWVRSISFSPDGRQLASASDDTAIRIWDVNDRRSIASFPYSRFDGASCVKFHANGWFVAACGKDNHVRIWDIRNKAILHSFAEHKSAVTSVDFHSGGDFVCSCGLDGTVKIYSLTDGRILYTLHGHENPVHSAQFTTDGEQLASADSKGQIFIWRTNFH